MFPANELFESDEMIPNPSPHRTNRHAMSLIETLVSIVVIASLTLTILPALASMRGDSLNEMSKANLMSIGQGRDQYALDNKDRIFSYSWIPGESYTLPDGRVKTGIDWQDAAAYQNQEILMRRTGRITGAFKIGSFTSRLPHRRFTHLVLLDYLAESNDAFNASTLAIDPADQNLLNWHERPLSYGSGSGVPYAEGIPFGYDSDLNWSNNNIRSRWPFSSSYSIVPASWQSDGLNGESLYVPTNDTPHLYRASGPNIVLGGRRMSQVAFPAEKVHLHEEFDFEQKRYPWFAYDLSSPEKLMFDGSINSEQSRRSNRSYHPENRSIWEQTYIPLNAHAIPLGGLNDSERLSLRFRWTLDGLQGVDYD